MPPPPSASTTRQATSSRPTLRSEEQARKCGRQFAKQIFNATQWKIIGTHPTEQIEIFESAPGSGDAGSVNGGGLRCVRAVRRLQGVIADVEAVLSATHRAQLYSALLPELYASGGCIADYGLRQHDTQEREYTNLQFALHHPHAWHATTPGSAHRLGADFDRHVLLEYALATQLQRTSMVETQDGTQATETRTVPSVLYLLRAAAVPFFSERHAEFEPHRTAQNDFGVTYIVQETDQPGTLSLEVVLTYSVQELPPPPPQPLSSTMRGSMRMSAAPTTPVPGTSVSQIMWREVVALTRIQALVDEVRDAKAAERRQTAPSIRMTTSRAPTSDPLSSRRTETIGRMAVPNSLPAPVPTPDRASTRIKMKELFTHKEKTKPKRKTSAADDDDATFDTGNAHSNGGGVDGCGICRKRFHAFRWKKRCETCLQAVCEQCLSTIANPASLRKKKKVCASCLYGGTNSGFERVTGAAAFAEDAAIAVARTPIPIATPPQSAPQPLASTRSNASSWASEEQSATSTPESEKEPANPYTSNSWYDETDPSGTVSDDECGVSNRVRRAQTVEIGDVSIKHLVKAFPPTVESFGPRSSQRSRARRRSFSNDRSDDDLQDFTLRLSKRVPAATANTTATAASTNARAALQFRQLKTPVAMYELDFDWLNAFPKAPVPKTARERERCEFMSTQLKLDAHTAMVYLRRDTVLEELTQNVVGSIATQWDGCSIHLIGEQQVFCLAYSYQAPLPVDDEAIETVTDDVVAREESASSHALYHQSAFFMPDLSKDDRFRAHPLHADGRVMSYLSLPIYSVTHRRWCIGTLDLWNFDPSGVSSHVSHDWWSQIERVLVRIATRIEELSLAHAQHTFQKPRAQKARSVGSSTDSRNSTRKDDSFEMDLRDLEEEEVLMPDDAEDEMDLLRGWTSSPQPVAALTPVHRPRRHTVADAVDPRFNGSFVSNSGSATSDFESTIESLLHRATRTSQYVREQSQARAV